jgi:hypothetical protein
MMYVLAGISNWKFVLSPYEMPIRSGVFARAGGRGVRVSFGGAKARDDRRGAESTEKGNGKPTAARFDETEPAATESTACAGHRFTAGKPTATAARFDETELAATESTARAGQGFRASCFNFTEVKNETLQH